MRGSSSRTCRGGRPAPAAEDDEVDTVGGLTFLLAGRIPQPGECVDHPSGWRLESVDADARGSSASAFMPRGSQRRSPS